jgi:hypothetical protein
MPSGLRFFTPKQVEAVSRVMSPSRPAVQAFVPQWDSKHPKWGGSYIAFWSLKIQQQMKVLPKPGSAYEFSGLAQRVAADPQTQVKLIAWLRNTFNGPMTFIKGLLDKYSPTSAPIHPGEFTWNLEVTKYIARLACVEYLNSICMASSGRYYDQYTGECSMQPSGVLGALPAVQKRVRPAPAFSRTRPSTGIVTWNSEHPQWPGSWLAFWSLKIQEAFANGVVRTANGFDVAPLGKRVAQDPDLQVKLIAWLRSSYSFPSTFVDAVWDEHIRRLFYNVPVPALSTLTWKSPKTWDLARIGADLYMARICKDSTGRGYNRSTGECARPGDLPTYVVGSGLSVSG